MSRLHNVRRALDEILTGTGAYHDSLLGEGNEILSFEDQAQNPAWYLLANGPPVDPWGRQRF